MSARALSLPVRFLAGFVFLTCAALLWAGSSSTALARRAQGWVDPSAPQMCTFKARTGVPCVGCGGTEAFGHAARGRFLAAARANLLGAYAGAAAWALLAASLLTLVAGRVAFLRSTALAAALALVPAFMANAALWWSSLPPGAAGRP